MHLKNRINIGVVVISSNAIVMQSRGKIHIINANMVAAFSVVRWTFREHGYN